ncbi:MAG: T9SS type A sorting domain-containing protein [Lewinellaceae bacterium]|nr:T9SS type A sorting domain-containing protein [Lewinellaceae bacterium]
MMKRNLLWLLLLAVPLFGISQVVLEDFEGGAKLPWNAIEGSFSVVSNPDTVGINPGGMVGSYTKKAGAAYSLFLAELAAPLDLSVNNQFRIMVKAPTPSAFILKLEGTSPAIEVRQNIAVANQWIEYTLNLSAAASRTGLNKVLIFFDPGVDASSDTYLFDNIVMEPSGACSGVVKDVAIWDDFECQRNVQYANPGYLDIEAVDNPDKSGINTSDRVGKYTDSNGEYHAMVMDYGEDIPLAARSLVKIKVWAPVAGNLLVKLEGGSSPAKEIPVPITEINKWVEYTVDFTSQAGASHKKLVFFFNAGVLPGPSDIYYIDDIRFAERPTNLVLEDFEGGAKLPWNPIEGSFLVLDNPPGGDTLMLNGSATVGAYTKMAGSSYSLFLAELAEPLNLALFNQFRIQVKSPVATSFILKLEGASGNIEGRKVIAVPNEWVEYTFNFSAAAAKTDFNKILLFFADGNAENDDTFLFDNLIAEESGACAGVAKDPEVLDDFECQRNIAYAQPGWTDVVVVDNPDRSAVNESDKVGKYTDTGSEYHAMVLDFGQDIPIADRPIAKIKVWAPVAGNLLVKLEGGSSGPKEYPVAVTETNKWVQYTVDMSDQIGASHRKLVFFFNAGKLPGENDVYYIDDIRMEAPSITAIEDFEGGPKLSWESLGATGVFGTFNGAIANPDATGANTSATVGSYTKGSSALGGLQALLPGLLDLSSLPQVNLQVWAPEGATSLTLRLFSGTEGLKEVNRPIAETGKWVDLSFNFDNFKTVTDFERVDIIFDPALASTSNWYFDNLTQTAPTIDACEGVEPKLGFVDDFDCQRNVTVTGGSDRLEVIRNPDPSGINSAANDKVGKYTDPTDPWSALVWDFVTPIDLSVLNQLHVKIWSPKAVPLLFKVEGGQQVEVWGEVAAANTSKWVEYVVDLSGAAGKGNTRLAIFFNGGVDHSDTDVYYIDDVEFRREPYTACISTFETPLDNLGKWQYFANGSLDGNQVDIVVDNPHKTGINMSDKVAEFIERPGGEIFAGMFTTALPSTVILPNDNKTISMKVWMDHAAKVVFKLERSTNGAPNTGDLKVDYTTPGEWQTLTWDFSGIVPDNAIYTLLTVIMDFDNKPTEEKRYYFDDIAIGGASCGAATPTRDITIASLNIAPNPAHDFLRVSNVGDIQNFVIYNTLGQQMAIINTSGQQLVDLPVNTLDKGMYILAGFNRQGQLVANARFIKE